MTVTLERPPTEEKTAERKTVSALLPERDTEFHWTVDAYYKAYDAGVFGDDRRLELIQGRIIEKMPPKPGHASMADIVAQMLRDAMQPAYIVREEKSIHFSSDTELVPDIMVARGARTDYRLRHPAPEEIALVVEVSNTTVVYDLGGKASLYARAGITDYWVMLVSENAVVVHRDPTPNGYSIVTRLAGEETLSPLAAPDTVWTINTLLGREDAPEEH